MSYIPVVKSRYVRDLASRHPGREIWQRAQFRICAIVNSFAEVREYYDDC